VEYAPIDFVFGVVVVLLAIRAAFRGLVTELLSILAVLLGIAAAVLFSGVVAGLLEPYVGATGWTLVLAFVAVFVVVFLLVKLFETALKGLIERIHLNTLDHALGLILGVVEGVLLSYIVILIIDVQPLFDPQLLLADSLFARLLLPFLPFAVDFLRTGRSDVR
jgi:membrane protein required for colicin V production